MEPILTETIQRHRVGLFSTGLHTYWSQFEGLRERFEGYNGQIAAKLEHSGAEVVNLGTIDAADKAVAAGHAMKILDCLGCGGSFTEYYANH